MSASLPAVDRPTPSVAIVGTDAVLAAAPATPVQLAHACLRRGFTVAVPASWGDELVATESLRRLATRERGPAVICVCPFARARLLGPGPDLAPFLVSLVSPPVAVARYLRSAYGEHGVRVTYIGACPGADDPSIDERLTPDAFIAELADHGISLSEQPLVFDSIVPPDRRRWCSLPGGVPNADSLWAETDGRTMVEIEREDVTTELAQHIMAREHVLLDLAPSLGCACSGAVGLVSPHKARAMVTAAEPPRALSPVIDPAAVVALDAPVTPTASDRGHLTPTSQPTGTPGAALERVLDELLGVGSPPEGDSARDADNANPDGAVILDLPELPRLPAAATAMNVDAPTVAVSIGPDAAPVAGDQPVKDETLVAATAPATLGPELGAESSVSSAPVVALVTAGGQNDPALGTEADQVVEPRAVSETTEAHLTEPTRDEQIEQIEQVEQVDGPEEMGEPEQIEQTTTEGSTGHRDTHVRRRTPPATTRYSGTSVPRASVGKGRPLPRAYVAKRRTPSAGAAAIPATPTHVPGSASSSTPTASPAPHSDLVQAPPGAAPVHTPPDVGKPKEPPRSVSLTGVAAMEPAGTTAVTASTASPSTTTPPSPGSTAVPGTSKAGSHLAARPSSTHPALVFLLVTALVALAVFVLLTLQR